MARDSQDVLCMRLSQALLASAFLVLFAPRARADVLSVYLQAHQNVGSGSANDLVPGATSPDLRRGLGWQAGVKVLVFEAYVDKTRYGTDASLTHAILGLRMGLERDNMNAYARAGAGVVEDELGVLTHTGQPGMQRGAVARAGVGLDIPLASRVFLEFAVDGEYFVLEPSANSDETTSGKAYFAGLGLKLVLGL